MDLAVVFDSNSFIHDHASFCVCNDGVHSREIAILNHEFHWITRNTPLMKPRIWRIGHNLLLSCLPTWICHGGLLPFRPHRYIGQRNLAEKHGTATHQGSPISKQLRSLMCQQCSCQASVLSKRLQLLQVLLPMYLGSLNFMKKKFLPTSGDGFFWNIWNRTVYFCYFDLLYYFGTFVFGGQLWHFQFVHRTSSKVLEDLEDYFHRVDARRAEVEAEMAAEASSTMLAGAVKKKGLASWIRVACLE